MGQGKVVVGKWKQLYSNNDKKEKDMYKGPMDKDNKWGRVVGGKWGQLYLHNNKKGNKK